MSSPLDRLLSSVGGLLESLLKKGIAKLRLVYFMTEEIADERLKRIEDKLERLIPPEKRFVSDIIGRIVDEFSKVLKIPKDAIQALLLFVPTLLAIFIARRQAFDIVKNETLWTQLSAVERGITLVIVYMLPIAYLSYFLLVSAQKIDKINRFYKKHIQKKAADVAYGDITSGKALHYDIDLYLSTIKFKPEQLINIIKYLRDTGQFLPRFQLSLMNNSENIITDPGIYPHIKESILKDEWNSGAVCKFITKMEGQLENEDLKKICTKYQQHRSVLFIIGSNQLYNSYNMLEEQKTINAGFNFKKHGRWSGIYRKIKLTMDIFVLGLLSVLIYELYTVVTLSSAGLITDNQFIEKITYIALSLAIVFFLGMFKQSNLNDIFYKMAIKWDIENTLKKEAITFVIPKELDSFIEDIIVAID